MRQCQVPDCNKKYLALGYCSAHYTKLRKYGDATAIRQVQKHGMTLPERILSYSRVMPSGCVEWTGYRDPNGYGRINIPGAPAALAHRVSFSLNCHEITSEDHVLHRCDNPPCINPSHLFIGTQADNNADMKRKGRMNPGLVHGESHGGSKLKSEDVLQIRASEKSPNELAKIYGVSRRQIRDVKARKSWKHI